jgi:TIGR03009 family protein
MNARLVDLALILMLLLTASQKACFAQGEANRASQPAGPIPANSKIAQGTQAAEQGFSLPQQGSAPSGMPAAPPSQPEWFPLPADQQKHVDQLLDYWQKSSEQVNQCTCDFTRWDYDPTYCAYRNPETQELAAFAVWRGEIRYASPDKAMFETTELYKFAMEDEKPTLEKSDDDKLKLKWLCDGKFIYDYDFVNKRLTEMEIPAEFQGAGLINSPLPFLFGANRKLLLDRFWIRPITPASATEEYWLLIVPKQLQDARTFSRVELVIARDDFLPKSMIMYPPDYDPKERPVSSAYIFENRKINGQLSKLQDFFSQFIRPKLPFGWERVERKPFLNDDVTAQKEELQRSGALR